MTTLSIHIQSIQHIRSLRFDVDLNSTGLTCLVGRNGAGKTTLMRAFRNLSNADTFHKTANPLIFSPESRIEYQVDGLTISFQYDSDIRTLNCKQSIPKSVRDIVSTELPMPYGARFNYHRSASDADGEIRQALVMGKYTSPHELIEFLSSVYSTDKFDSLVEVSAKGKSFFCIPLPQDRYIREDYLSSGEYFLINLYRTIKGSSRLIAVDEIDLSLDAAAQAKLADWLRNFCATYQRSILFTTHSLAVMRTLLSTEIRYIEHTGAETTHHPASYSYVKARLFGFSGWDRYILTEDIELKDLIEGIIQYFFNGTFFTYKVIYIGGATQVTDLLRRNEVEHFLSEPKNVIAILDGDRREIRNLQHESVHFIPIDSVEKAIHGHYQDEDFPYRLPRTREEFTGPKDLFNAIRDQRVASTGDLHDFLFSKHAEKFSDFASTIGEFLGASRTASAARE